MGVHGPGGRAPLAACVTPPPHPGEELAAILHLTTVAGEVLEEPELHRGESHGLAVADDAFLPGVDDEGPDPQCLDVLPLVAMPPKHRLEPQAELPGPDGFGHEVVGAELEGDDPIDLTRSLRHEDHEDVTTALTIGEMPEELRRRHVGRVFVEENRGRAPTERAFERHARARHVLDAHVVVGKCALQL